eukprot:jgi/Bigna1/83937/fgenesh1_pg.119_\
MVAPPPPPSSTLLSCLSLTIHKLFSSGGDGMVNQYDLNQVGLYHNDAHRDVIRDFLWLDSVVITAGEDSKICVCFPRKQRKSRGISMCYLNRIYLFLTKGQGHCQILSSLDTMKAEKNAQRSRVMQHASNTLALMHKKIFKLLCLCCLLRSIIYHRLCHLFTIGVDIRNHSKNEGRGPVRSGVSRSNKQSHRVNPYQNGASRGRGSRRRAAVNRRGNSNASRMQQTRGDHDTKFNRNKS